MDDYYIFRNKLPNKVLCILPIKLNINLCCLEQINLWKNQHSSCEFLGFNFNRFVSIFVLEFSSSNLLKLSIFRFIHPKSIHHSKEWKNCSSNFINLLLSNISKPNLHMQNREILYSYRNIVLNWLTEISFLKVSSQCLIIFVGHEKADVIQLHCMVLRDNWRDFKY